MHPDAAQESARLCGRIGDAILAEGGWIGFDRYMQMALYEPGLGYYTGGAEKFGGAGDFVTAPEISPLFGRTLARQIAEIIKTAGGDILELGPGTGALAVDVLGELERIGVLPSRYLLLDVSGTLRARQHERIGRELPHLRHRVQWLDTLPETLYGVVVANEVMDAIPFHLIHWTEAGALERGVAMKNGAFVFEDRSITSQTLRDAVATIEVEAPYVSEINLQSMALIRSLAQCLQRGALVLVDYGFGRGEYYHPQRSRGTMMCHYQHRAHDDPFFVPGLQDITAHVDFTAIATAGASEGMQLLGYTTQAHFLINCGITELMSAIDAEDAPNYLQMSSQVQKLLSPAEMGELFKVMVLGRGIGSTLRGFLRGDLSRML